MTKHSPLPFDALRPFKSKPEDFTPKDTIPWEAQAAQLLRCRTEEGFAGLRAFRTVDEHTAWLVENLALPPGAVILDIGCGPGMYSHRLGERGYRATGIDIAWPLLDYAQSQADAAGLSCSYHHLSFLDMSFENAFDAALFINSTINQLTGAELRQTLVNIRAALKPGGQLICEAAIEPKGFQESPPAVDEELLFLARSPWSEQFHAWLKRDLTFPASGERVDHHLVLTADGHPREYWSRFTLYHPQTLVALLAEYGFEVQAIYGRDLGSPLQPTDETCFIWAKRR